jgi:hypothetical protein
MTDQNPDRRPLLKRPLRDVTIGTALKAYALWVIGGFVITAIVALVLFGAVSGGDDATGGDSTIIAGGGHPITLAQYRSVKRGAVKSDVVARLGRPATTDDPLQSPTPKELRDDCIGYERTGGNGDLLYFCFGDDGRLTRKHTL